MKAAQIVTLSGPSAIVVNEVDEPTPGPEEVLVDVTAAGVAFPDVLLSRGLYQYKPSLPFSPGSEFSGVVRTAPEGSRVKAGDRVVGFGLAGAFQEVVAMHRDWVFPVPDGYDLAVAAGVPMNYLTMGFALGRRGQLQPGETVLVQGAAGGIGTASIQVAKALGARVIGVVSTPEKAEVAKAAGADETVLADGFLAAVKDVTGGKGVDVVVDPVGGDRFTDSLRSLGVEGRLLVIGFTGGDIPTVRVNRLLLNNIDVRGVGWGAFALAKPGAQLEEWDRIAPHLASGALVPPVGQRFPLAEAGAAVAVLEDRAVLGKVLIDIG